MSARLPAGRQPQHGISQARRRRHRCSAEAEEHLPLRRRPLDLFAGHHGERRCPGAGGGLRNEGCGRFRHRLSAGIPRESTAIKDYYDPGVIVFGASDKFTLDRLESIHAPINRPKFVVDIKTAEGIKYTNNAWHALKISFSNEIGNILSKAGIDSHVALDILCADDRLNISKAYLTPGFAFGGSCLPKDLRALISMSRRQGTPAPLLEATLSANEVQINRAYSLIANQGSRKVGIVGLSFKPDTDDLRESPLVELAERLYGRGYQIKIFDPNIRMNRLTGANASFVSARLPHLAELLNEDIESVLSDSDVIVVGNRAEMNGSLKRVKPETHIIDLVRVDKTLRSEGNYHGICW